MSELSLKALEILQTRDTKIEFHNSDLVSCGFSEATTKFIINELEENGCIFITRTFINGTVMFELM